MTDSFTLTIDSAHPSLPGHFPGEPIVPGAVLLDHAIAHIEQAVGRRVAGIVAAKFLMPVRPAQDLVIDVRRHGDGQVAMTASFEGRPAFSVSVTLEGEGNGDDQRVA